MDRCFLVIQLYFSYAAYIPAEWRIVLLSLSLSPHLSLSSLPLPLSVSPLSPLVSSPLSLSLLSLSPSSSPISAHSLSIPLISPLSLSSHLSLLSLSLCVSFGCEFLFIFSLPPSLVICTSSGRFRTSVPASRALLHYPWCHSGHLQRSSSRFPHFSQHTFRSPFVSLSHVSSSGIFSAWDYNEALNPVICFDSCCPRGREERDRRRTYRTLQSLVNVLWLLWYSFSHFA